MGFVKVSKQTWSCLFFHVHMFPGLGVAGNKFGTKHTLMYLHSATACTECTRSSPGSSRSEPHRNGWAPEGPPAPCVPLRPLFPLTLPIFPPVLSILPLSLYLTFFECSSLLSCCHSFSLSKLSHCLMPPCFIPEPELVSVVTADVDRSPESLLDQTQTPAPLDWRGLPHLERGGPEPWGAPSHANTPLICCEHLAVNKGSWIFPRARERSAEGFYDVSLKCRLQTEPLWERAVLGYFQSGHIPVFIPLSCGANRASGNSRSWDGLVRLEPWFAFSTIPEKVPWLSVWWEMVGNKISDFWVLELKVIPFGISARIMSLQWHER